MIRAGIANEYLPGPHCVATPKIRRTCIDRVAMVEAATDGIAFDKLDTHYGLSSLPLKSEDYTRFKCLCTERWIKFSRLNGRTMDEVAWTTLPFW